METKTVWYKGVAYEITEEEFNGLLSGLLDWADMFG